MTSTDNRLGRPPPPSRPGPRGRAGPARGLTLVEVLISFLVLAVGLAAVSRLQAHLRLSAELARQRAEAVRLAQADLEGLRAFVQLAPDPGGALPSYAAIGPLAAQPAGHGHTPYTLERRVATHEVPRHKAVTVTVRWSDRFGDRQQVELATVVAGIDPALGGWLGWPRPAAGPVSPQGRHPAIPLTARDLGDGRSVFKPAGSAGVAWVFDHASGRITSICNVAPQVAQADLSPAHLRDCTPRLGLLVAGFVRFATHTDTPGPHDAERPPSPTMDLDLCLSAADAPACGGATLAECFDDAPAGPGHPLARTVIYHCAVFPPPGSPHWSGRLNLAPQGWVLQASPDAYKACRYSFDHNGNGRIDNPEHPARYTQVTGPLTDQNFLVVRGGADCPVDRPVNIGAAAPDNVVNDSTVQHQP